MPGFPTHSQERTLKSEQLPPKLYQSADGLINLSGATVPPQEPVSHSVCWQNTSFGGTNPLSPTLCFIRRRNTCAGQASDGLSPAKLKASVCHVGSRRLTRKVWHVLLCVLGPLFHNLNVCVFFFSSSSVAAYPQGFFFYTCPICAAISPQYICVSTGLLRKAQQLGPQSHG